jgi:hypothetical protein
MRSIEGLNIVARDNGYLVWLAVRVVVSLDDEDIRQYKSSDFDSSG